MATTDANFSRRGLMRDRCTLVVTLHHPIHHRALFWLGFRVIAFGAWIAGFAGAKVEQEP